MMAGLTELVALLKEPDPSPLGGRIFRAVALFLFTAASVVLISVLLALRGEMVRTRTTTVEEHKRSQLLACLSTESADIAMSTLQQQICNDVMEWWRDRSASP